MPDKAARPTRDELAEYFAAEQQLERLAKQADPLKRLQKAVAAKALAYVLENGGPERCSIVCGYRLAIDKVPNAVQWKTELLELLADAIGKDKAAKQCDKIAAAAGTKDKITIEAPSAS